MAHTWDTMHSKFVEALVGDQLVDGREGLEEHHQVVLDESTLGLSCKGQHEVGYDAYAPSPH